MLKIKHVPFRLFDVTATPIMFTLLFTYFFGGALAGTPREYIQYLLPGIVVQTISFITVYTGVGLNSDIRKGLYDRFRSSPIWQPSPLFGALVADVSRYSFATLLMLVIGLILGFRPQGGVLGVLLAVALVLVFCFARARVSRPHARHSRRAGRGLGTHRRRRHGASGGARRHAAVQQGALTIPTRLRRPEPSARSGG